MKKNQFLLLMLIFGLISCSKSTQDSDKPFQGPQNPSFEIEGSSSEAPQYWSFQTSAACEIIRNNGLEFMPTNGSWYLEFLFSNLTASTAELLAWQENVDLSNSKKLSFDYSYSFYANVTIQILFTANGTIKLWEKSFTNSPDVTKEQLNETITLPNLPNAGKFTIRLVSTGLGSLSKPMGYFKIDNIAVE